MLKTIRRFFGVSQQAGITDEDKIWLGYDPDLLPDWHKNAKELDGGGNTYAHLCVANLHVPVGQLGHNNKIDKVFCQHCFITLTEADYHAFWDKAVEAIKDLTR